MKTRHVFLVMTMLAAITVTLVSCGRKASESTPASESAAPAAPPAAGPATTTNAITKTNAP